MANKCNHCGAKIKKGDIFCPECGAHVDSYSIEDSIAQKDDRGSDSNMFSDAGDDTGLGKKNSKRLRTLLIIAFVCYISGFIFTTVLDYNRNPYAYSSVDAYLHSSKRPGPPDPENAKDNYGLLVGQSAEFTNGFVITLDSVNPDFKVAELNRSYIQAKFTIENTGNLKYDFHPFYMGSETSSGEYEYSEAMSEPFGPDSLGITMLHPGDKVEGYLYFNKDSVEIVYEDKMANNAHATWIISDNN